LHFGHFKGPLFSETDAVAIVIAAPEFSMLCAFNLVVQQRHGRMGLIVQERSPLPTNIAAGRRAQSPASVAMGSIQDRR